MRRKIPSTAALIAFEAAARHESFTRAADELALTQSAICRQIGGTGGIPRPGAVPSFAARREAHRRRPVLRPPHRSAAGRGGARHAVGDGPAGRHEPELAVVPTFGTQWLVPRLRHFRALHPEITVNLTNRTRPFLLADTEFDAAIYFGDADWSGTEAHYLMPEDLQPVCSPALLRDGQPFTTQAPPNCRCFSRPPDPMPGGSGSIHWD